MIRTVSLPAPPSLAFDTPTSHNLSGIISGDGTLRKSNSGTLTLSGNNTYTGKTTIGSFGAGSGVVLKVSSLNSVNEGSPLLAYSSLGAPTTVANGTIDLGTGNTRSVNLTYNGSGETTDRVMNITFNGGNTPTIQADNTVGVLKFTSSFTASGSNGGFFTLTGSGKAEISGNLPSTSGSSGLKKDGTGTWTLSGAGAFTAPTTVSLGTLIARNASALGTGATANVSIVAGASATGLNYVAATDTALNIGGTLTINGGANTFVGGSIGNTATSASINVGVNAIATAAAVKVNVYGVSEVSRPGTPDVTTTTYTLITGGIGGATQLDDGIYTLGTVFNNTDFTVANIVGSTTTTTDLTIDVTKRTALTSGTYYVGGLSIASNVWAASNGIDASNFSTSSGGTSQVLVPGSAASVIIDSSSNATSTVLGADMSISGLTISDNTNNFALNADGYSLKIGTGGITKNNTTTKTATIASNIVLGGNQTWSNSDTGNALVISGIVTGANNLTVSGAGNTTVSGRLMTGTGTLTKSGNGTLTLSGTNTYTGATTVTGTGSKLIVNGNISTSFLTTVQTGATLGGSGSVGALTIDSGGFFSPGNSPGIETVNGNYIQNGTLQVEIESDIAGNGTGFHDQVVVNGTVTLNGLLDLMTFTGTYAADDLIFLLLNDDTDAVSGTFTGLAQGATVGTHAGFDWQISYTGNQTSPGVGSFTGGNDVVLMAIPEPRAALLGGLGMLLLLRRRRN